MKRVDWLRGAAIFLLVAVLLGVGAACLPDNEYQRYETLENTIQKRMRWIYERTHYDPAPIDIAVLGPSRTGAAVNGPRFEADLKAAGRRERPVNFSLAENGRDLHWVLEQQLLAAKSPKLLVIGVIEKPGRYGHPAYKYIAPARAVVDPGYAANLSYPANLVYLPYRQLRLAWARLFPQASGLPARFDPARYAGSNPDFTVSFRAADDIAPPQPTPEQLEAGRVRYERGVQPPLFPRFADQEFGNERVYVRRMAEAARARGISVVFLFLPYFGGPNTIQERALYERYGPILDASFLATHPEWYSDVAHLNPLGAEALTDWLAPRLVPLLAARDRH